MKIDRAAPTIVLLTLRVSCVWCTSWNVDFGKISLPFQGIGAISGGGGTSRLLFDYPEPQRQNILDLLFLPQHGANIQVCYVKRIREFAFLEPND